MQNRNTIFDLRSELDQEYAVGRLGLLQGTSVQDDRHPRTTSKIWDGEKLTTSEPANQPLPETPQINQATPPGNELLIVINIFIMLTLLLMFFVRWKKRTMAKSAEQDQLDETNINYED